MIIYDNFAAGMDFDTSYILNEMSQMHDLCPSNCVPPIFYGNNLQYLSDCNCATMVAQNCLRISVNQIFCQF